MARQSIIEIGAPASGIGAPQGKFTPRTKISVPVFELDRKASPNFSYYWTLRISNASYSQLFTAYSPLLVNLATTNLTTLQLQLVFKQWITVFDGTYERPNQAFHELQESSQRLPPTNRQG